MADLHLHSNTKSIPVLESVKQKPLENKECGSEKKLWHSCSCSGNEEEADSFSRLALPEHVCCLVQAA